jgi:hypothetical protein
MTDTAWYDKMAAAMRKRDRCLTALAKWQTDLAAAEAEIQALRESDAADVTEDKTEPEATVPHYDDTTPKFVVNGLE